MVICNPQKEILSSQLLEEYLTFLKDHQCLAPASLSSRRRDALAFLTGLQNKARPSALRILKPDAIHDYLITAAKFLSRGSRKGLLSSVRGFLKFLHFRGYLTRDLVPAVPMIKTPILAQVPRTIPWDWVKRILSAPDRRTRRGRRNYAILQLLASYGVRIGQALSLRLSDIKWEEGLIYFQTRKSCKQLCFPIQKQVAQALFDYIRKDRRRAPFPQLFLTVKGEQKPLSTNINFKPFLKNCRKCTDIQSRISGWHSIRHAFATRLMEQEVPIKTIADLLGHRRINSTYIYTKVDLHHLRILAREWPEVLS